MTSSRCCKSRDRQWPEPLPQLNTELNSGRNGNHGKRPFSITKPKSRDYDKLIMKVNFPLYMYILQTQLPSSWATPPTQRPPIPTTSWLSSLLEVLSTSLPVGRQYGYQNQTGAPTSQIGPTAPPSAIVLFSRALNLHPSHVINHICFPRQIHLVTHILLLSHAQCMLRVIC